MPTLNFTVDSALLAELGERLVGRPYIAVAELVKNGYDADATKVWIELEPQKDRIVVGDNGHGMDFQEFKNFWMRLGSTHKLIQRVSRNFKRPMTGSKGVGRLAVQYLAEEMEIFTVSERDVTKRLKAHVKWKEAVKAGDLTKATAEYEIENSGQSFKHGTEIVLTHLKHPWDAEQIQGLAREVWWLEPPFRGRVRHLEDQRNDFSIEFFSKEEKYKKVFNEQMHAILDIWHARLVGKNDNGKGTLSLEFVDKETIIENFSIPNCTLENGDFEIRIYHLEHRQPRGISVGEARKYFNAYGGVHVYDGGFHLPYYGNPLNDWLKVEFAHSHRLTLSELLPKKYRVEQGLQFLPTLSRIFGVVNVNTAKEEELRILITRDRLQETNAFKNLIFMVRYALDFYAYKEKLRNLEEAEEKKEVEKPKYRKVEDVLEKYQAEIPEKTFGELRQEVKKVTDEIETEAESTAKQVGLMGSLATAGISALAAQHETRVQFDTIDDIIESIGLLEAEIKEDRLRNKLRELKKSLSSWVDRTRAANALFSYFADSENVKTRKRFLAKKVIEEIREQVEPLARGIPIRTSELENNLLLPEASIVEWSSIFQNVFLNAFNAMVDSERKLIAVSSKRNDKIREILIQDTGCGVDLDEAEVFFEPFERRVKISPERRTLGYGGMGLGLTIVRLIARNIGCEVKFVKPNEGFKTAFSLKWMETE